MAALSTDRTVGVCIANWSDEGEPFREYLYFCNFTDSQELADALRELADKVEKTTAPYLHIHRAD